VEPGAIGRNRACAPRTADQQERIMWYFSWILGIGVALAFGIINVMWLEAEFERDRTPIKRNEN
jgi:cyd operon protein YbgT